MLFVKSLFKKSEENLQLKEVGEVFSSIDDLPQWNWNMIHKTGNLAYIKKLKSYRKVEIDDSLVLEQIWLSIYDEYLEEFGLSKEYKDILERKKDIARMKNEFILTDNRSLLNFIKIEELELEATFDKSEGMSFESVVNGIEKLQRIPIKIKEITVYEYNNYLRTLKEQKDGE
jgi:hypothetical protein